MKENILDRFERLLADVGGISLAIIMIVTVLSVLGRYVFKMDLIPGAYNIIERVLFPMLVFLSIPRTYAEGSFPKLELVTERLSKRNKDIMNFVRLLIELAIYCLLTWYVGKFFFDVVARSQQIQVGVVRWPLTPIMFTVFLSFVLLTTEFVRSLIRAIIVLRKPVVAQQDSD